ncbi:uncharacterized protein LOC115050924 [Echeneis naucrates]|uniref:uncharacterized protein LOC115050924 n=1 Tax=Echeneis naucrates TaxID=173247 RepID=UPI001114362D|nr:uncharacterized protein LOC115050924 [Echeneis naucrates]
MGCSTSSQTSAVDTIRPSAKTEDSNGASTTGVANESDKAAEDSETLPDQTPADAGDAKPADEPVAAAACAASTAAAPPAGEEPQPAEEEAAGTDSPAEGAETSSEPAAEAPEQEKADTAAAEEPKEEEPPAPSE